MINFARRVKNFAMRKAVRQIYHQSFVRRAIRNRRRGIDNHVVSNSDGSRVYEGRPTAIFLIWQPREISWSVQNALDALSEARINTLLVVNHPLDDSRSEELRTQCSRLMIRDNTGFDIGGYKDATRLLLAEADTPPRLIYLNDSVYFFRYGLAEMLARLEASEADLCSAFENWEFTYHLQSFCFSVSPRMLRDKNFASFWNNYLPANSRLWAIQEGEIGMSRALLPAARSIDILYNLNTLREPLLKLGREELVRCLDYMPKGIRIDLNAAREIPGDVLVDMMIKKMDCGSQIHTAGFFFRRFEDCPIMKRDLVYRLQFSIYEVEANLADMDAEGRASAILTDMRRKGRADALTGWDFWKVSEGII